MDENIVNTDELTGFYYVDIGTGREIVHLTHQEYIPNEMLYTLKGQRINGDSITTMPNLSANKLLTLKLDDQEGQLEWALAKMKS